MLRACWIITLLSLCACDEPSPRPAPAAEAEPAATKAPPPRRVGSEAEGWSRVRDDLQIRAGVPEGVASPGSELTITLMFRNTGTRPRRVYLIKGEPFRVLQSTFFLDRGDAKPPVQPEPPPPGYVITEADFPEIAPDETRSFTQTLRIPADLAPGTYSVRWKYENDIDRWEGGSMTLDGYSKPLFGGKPIPGIWKGTLEVSFDVVVGKK